MIDLFTMTSDSAFRSNTSRPTVGVVGGGQLAKMLAEAAIKRNINVVVQTPLKGDPAVAKSSDLILASPTDYKATEKLLDRCDVVTFENEWLNIEKLTCLPESQVKFLPSISSLSLLVDKISQRKLLSSLQIPGPEWIGLDSDKLIDGKLPIGWNFPVMAKAGRGGYDGKGTKIIRDSTELNLLLSSVDKTNWLIEAWVEYEKELALVASRDSIGNVRSFPMVETHQFHQVCDWVLAPADVDHDVELMAYNIVASLLTELNYVGVIAVEFFFGPNGLQVNEIAPRTHNSAHFSLDACSSSQFDHQISIVAGLPVSEPKLIVPGALMVNLLGLKEGLALPLEQRLIRLRSCHGVSLHWYQKDKEVPGRKLGHATVFLQAKSAAGRKREAVKALENIRSIWPIHSS